MSGHSLFDVSGKRGYVTGGGSGLGRAIALGMAEAGAAVVVSDINQEAAQKVGEEIRAQHGEARSLAIDVSQKDQVERLIQTTTEELGGLDFAFNNAGILKLGKPEDISQADWQEELNVDLTGVFLCCQAAGRYMMDHGGGKIVNTASISGLNSQLGADLFDRQGRCHSAHPGAGHAVGETRRVCELFQPRLYSHRHDGAAPHPA